VPTAIDVNFIDDLHTQTPPVWGTIARGEVFGKLPGCAIAVLRKNYSVAVRDGLLYGDGENVPPATKLRVLPPQLQI
jgi:hypothetical protein